MYFFSTSGFPWLDDFYHPCFELHAWKQIPAPTDAGICASLIYGVQPLGACMPDLLIEFRFAIVTGTSGTSSFLLASGLPFTSASIIWTAERPIVTGCYATT